MWEIAENLHRADLTVLERSEHIAEWIRLSNAKAQLEPSRHSGGRPDKGINAAVRDLDLERNEAQRAVKIDGISDEAKKPAKEAKIDDKQSALLEVAAQPSPEAQLAAIKQKKDHDEAQKKNRKAKQRELQRKADNPVCRARREGMMSPSALALRRGRQSALTGPC